MIGVGALRAVALAALLACAIVGFSEPALASPAGAAVQDRIADVVEAIIAANRGSPTGEIPAMADELSRSTGGDREVLLVGLVRFAAEHPGNESVMGAALLIDYYEFSNDEKIAALTPHIGTADTQLGDLVWEVLGTVDRPQEARAAVRRVRRLERLLDQGAQVTPPDPESVRLEIDELSRNEIWWIRLYAAHALRSRPDLGPDTAERLRSDPDPRVREAAGG